MDESHLSSLSHRSYCLQIRPRLWLWLRLCCIFSLCSHWPFFSQRQSPSTTTISSTPPMPFPSSSPSPHHSTTQLQPSESGEYCAARVLGIANSPTHSSIHACASLHGLTFIKPLHLHPHNRALSNSFRVQCLLANKVPNSRTTARSKHAVPRLLDRLARDAVQTARKEGYIKIATMLGDVQCSHSLEGRHPRWQYQY